MAYAEQADIVQLYGERLLEIVGDRDRDGVVDEDAVELALESASSEIDSYLATRYPVPLTDPPPQMVVQACVDIAVYRLAYNTTSLTEEMRVRYTDTIAWLKLVAKGDAQLPDVGNQGPDDDEDGGLQEITGGKRAGFFYSVRG